MRDGRFLSRGLLASTLTLVILAGSTVSATEASFTLLGDFPGGGHFNMARAVSADGSVVVGYGKSERASPEWGKDFEAFLWTEATGMVPLGDLPGGYYHSRAYGVSADGSVIVGSSDMATGSVAFRWTEATGIRPLDALPANATKWYADGVSADGSVVCGKVEMASSSVPMRWSSEGGLQLLGNLSGGPDNGWGEAISSDGTAVVGWSERETGSKAFRWTEAEGMIDLGDLPGGRVHSSAQGTSADGSVVVGTSFSGPADRLEGFRWTRETGMVGLGFLPDGVPFSIAACVSADGSFVGGCAGTVNGYEAVIWDEAGNIQGVEDLLINHFHLDLEGWDLRGVEALSPDGRILAGWADTESGQREAWMAVVPEPSVVCLLAVAGSALTVRRRV